MTMRVVANAAILKGVDQLADLGVGVLEEAGVDFHQAGLEGAFLLRQILPRRHPFRTRGTRRVGRNPADLLLPLEDPLLVGVPAIVELALVFVGPFGGDVVRTVDRARRPPHQEGAVGVDGEVAVHPGDRLVRHRLGQVEVLMVLDVGRGNRVGVLP